jgi:hypothetical protein
MLLVNAFHLPIVTSEAELYSSCRKLHTYIPGLLLKGGRKQSERAKKLLPPLHYGRHGSPMLRDYPDHLKTEVFWRKRCPVMSLQSLKDADSVVRRGHEFLLFAPFCL